ncbi:hypothetical protein HDU67_004304 [Dinochytrium kinnereticum]|nr:hypothetical protein HDU67_004304 [Dinochytrium kinnereticum]
MQAPPPRHVSLELYAAADPTLHLPAAALRDLKLVPNALEAIAGSSYATTIVVKVEPGHVEEIQTLEVSLTVYERIRKYAKSKTCDGCGGEKTEGRKPCGCGGSKIPGKRKLKEKLVEMHQVRQPVWSEPRRIDYECTFAFFIPPGIPPTHVIGAGPGREIVHVLAGHASTGGSGVVSIERQITVHSCGPRLPPPRPKVSDMSVKTVSLSDLFLAVKFPNFVYIQDRKFRASISLSPSRGKDGTITITSYDVHLIERVVKISSSKGKEKSKLLSSASFDTSKNRSSSRSSEETSDILLPIPAHSRPDLDIPSFATVTHALRIIARYTASSVARESHAEFPISLSCAPTTAWKGKEGTWRLASDMKVVGFWMRQYSAACSSGGDVVEEDREVDERDEARSVASSNLSFRTAVSSIGLGLFGGRSGGSKRGSVDSIDSSTAAAAASASAARKGTVLSRSSPSPSPRESTSPTNTKPRSFSLTIPVPPSPANKPASPLQQTPSMRSLGKSRSQSFSQASSSVSINRPPGSRKPTASPTLTTSPPPTVPTPIAMNARSMSEGSIPAQVAATSEAAQPRRNRDSLPQPIASPVVMDPAQYHAAWMQYYYQYYAAANPGGVQMGYGEWVYPYHAQLFGEQYGQQVPPPPLIMPPEQPVRQKGAVESRRKPFGRNPSPLIHVAAFQPEEDVEAVPKRATTPPAAPPPVVTEEPSEPDVVRSPVISIAESEDSVATLRGEVGLPTIVVTVDEVPSCEGDWTSDTLVQVRAGCEGASDKGVEGKVSGESRRDGRARHVPSPSVRAPMPILKNRETVVVGVVERRKVVQGAGELGRKGDVVRGELTRSSVDLERR